MPSEFVTHIRNDLFDVVVVWIANQVTDLGEIRNPTSDVFKRRIIRLGIRLEFDG